MNKESFSQHGLSRRQAQHLEAAAQTAVEGDAALGLTRDGEWFTCPANGSLSTPGGLEHLVRVIHEAVERVPAAALAQSGDKRKENPIPARRLPAAGSWTVSFVSRLRMNPAQHAKAQQKL
jgi:hypothetical protein